MRLRHLLASTIVIGLSCGAAGASAAPVLGSNVDSTVFSAAIGSTTGWSYLGQSTGAFVGPGMGEVELRSANNPNSFGYGSAVHGSATTVFGTGAGVGATAGIAGLAPNYLFWFNSNPNGAADDNTQWTDGFATGGPQGTAAGDIDIFRNLTMNMWAFFYDDGGPNGSQDDNDYNDMVVSFRQAVPEPASMALLGLGLLAAGGLARRRRVSQG